MGVHTDGHLECTHQGIDAAADILGGHRARGVGDIDGVRTVGLQQLRLLNQSLGGIHVRHHEETDGFHAEFFRDLDVLLGDVGLGAVHRDARHGDTEFAHLAQVICQADARESSGRRSARSSSSHTPWR